MSGLEKGYVPLKEAKSERVQIEVVVPPFVDGDRIGVNLGKIQRMCQLGGIRNLHVISFTEQGVSSETMKIAGLGRDGAALAGRVMSKVSTPVERSKSSRDSLVLGHMFGMMHAKQWFSTEIAINLDEVSKVIERESKWDNGIRSPEAWAHYLNSSVKDGIANEGTLHLLNLDWTNRVGFAIVCAIILNAAFNYDFLGKYHPHIPNVWELLGNYLSGSFFMNTVVRADTARQRFSDSMMRYSLCFGPQIDRAFLLNLFAPRTALVKAF